MYIYELFSYACLGEIIQSRQQYLIKEKEMNPHLELDMYEWIANQLYSSSGPILGKHIQVFLDYHCKAYMKRYAQSTNWAFVTTLEDWLVSIEANLKVGISKQRQDEIHALIFDWCNIAYKHPSIHLDTELVEQKLLSSIFNICETFPSNGSKWSFYSINREATESNMEQWLLGELYCSVVRGEDLGNAVKKQEYLTDFLDYHLQQYNVKYKKETNNSFVVEVILLVDKLKTSSFALENEKYTKRVNQLVENWCYEKAPSCFTVQCELISNVKRFERDWRDGELDRIFDLLIKDQFIDSNTSRNLFIYYMGGEVKECHVELKPILWLKSIQLLREFVEHVVQYKNITKDIKIILSQVFERNGKPVNKLSNRKTFPSQESSHLFDLFADINN